MKISELMERLQEYLVVYGDLKVVAYNRWGLITHIRDIGTDGEEFLYINDKNLEI